MMGEPGKGEAGLAGAAGAQGEEQAPSQLPDPGFQLRLHPSRLSLPLPARLRPAQGPAGLLFPAFARALLCLGASSKWGGRRRGLGELGAADMGQEGV